MKLFKIFLFSALMFMTCDMPAQSVYITKSGEKYHKTTCHYLKYSKKEITLIKARELGFTACSACKPSYSKNSNSLESLDAKTPISPLTKPRATASQCIGKTKVGTRCKRMTKNSNGRCYQH